MNETIDRTLALSSNQRAALGMHAMDYANATAAYRVHVAVHGDEPTDELVALGNAVRDTWRDLSRNMETMRHMSTWL